MRLLLSHSILTLIELQVIFFKFISIKSTKDPMLKKMFANFYGLLLNFEQNKNSWVVQKILGCDFILILLDKVSFVKNMWLKSEKK